MMGRRLYCIGDVGLISGKYRGWDDKQLVNGALNQRHKFLALLWQKIAEEYPMEKIKRHQRRQRCEELKSRSGRRWRNKRQWDIIMFVRLVARQLELVTHRST